MVGHDVSYESPGVGGVSAEVCKALGQLVARLHVDLCRLAIRPC